ncbi:MULTISPECIES: cation transporter [Sphingomonas]|uniref:Cation transporter n=1 Tax=Sphingomonas carotinifaciens TaxID=1166323 RepID=A0A1G7LHP2_9SPHN|nr:MULTISPECIES: cation transporter [Sphingomonas]MBB4085638.1 putative Co/Zn/Cd cation transporter (cation efflux family) [Sphingomonas carotinifaciens]MWC43344.1 cation transporter [Sphingomonas carotinifaciens]SDF48520.1 Predicted Co/Zn/Cd cation transporter, cation efflux family [Sphingomonas carotinifaciens]
MNGEQRLLRNSMIVTVMLAGVGVVVGTIAGSDAIVFDGMYSLADAAMTALALGVARLIAASNAADAAGGRLHERFTMGFWHLEPIVLGLNGVLLTGASIYALVNAITALLSDGRPLSFGPAMAYAAIGTAADIAMAVYVTRANRTVRSQLVALDGRAWIMTSALGAALFVAFALGAMLQGTRHAWMTPYVDPAALVVICLVIIPAPFQTIRAAVSDILLVTPPALKLRVDGIAQATVDRYGFVSYRAYVARVGRGTQIELNFIVPPDTPARRLEEWDALRDRIGEELGDDTPNRWLTIVFTTDPEWAV